MPADGSFPMNARPSQIVIFALALSTSTALAAEPNHPRTTPDITAADLLARDKAISDDAFQGRGPGTEAGEAAAQWIADEMKRIGLKPGNHGSYFQTVPSVTIAMDAAKSSRNRHTPTAPQSRNSPTKRCTGRRNTLRPT